MLGKEIHSIEKKKTENGKEKFRNITDVLNSVLRGKIEY